MAKRKAAARKTGNSARGRKKAASRPNARTGTKRAAARSSHRPARAAGKKTARPAGRKGARKAAARKTAARKTATRKAAARKTAARKTAAKVPARTQTSRKAAAPRKAAPRQATSSALGSPTADRRPAPLRPARPAALDRERRILREDQEQEPHGVPSSLDYDRSSSSFDTGRAEMLERRGHHHDANSMLTAGDVDADWEGAYSTGEEAPGGDNPTPDQDVVEEIGRALGVEYQDNEELHEKVAERDEHRWELDPASSEDYRDRKKE